MTDITKQAREIIDESAAKLLELGGEGRKVADKFIASFETTTEKGRQAFEDVASELSVQELMEHFGSLKVPDFIDKLKSLDLASHGDVIRQELMTALDLPTNESVEKLQLSVDKLNKEISGFRTLKGQVTRLSNQVKTLKTKAARAAKASKAAAARKTTKSSNKKTSK